MAKHRSPSSRMISVALVRSASAVSARISGIGPMASPLASSSRETSTRNACHGEDRLAHLAMSTVATGPNSLRMWEVLLGLLKEGGVDDTRLVAGVDMLLLHVTTIAAEECNRRAIGQDFERIPNALANASAEQFPLVSALFQRGMFSAGDDDDARVRWALDVIIDGITVNQINSISQPTAKSSV